MRAVSGLLGMRVGQQTRPCHINFIGIRSPWRRSRKGRVSLFWVVVLTAVIAREAPAQRRSPQARRPAPFARYVPDSAKLFLHIRQLEAVDAAMHRAHAWELLPFAIHRDVGSRRPLDLRAAVVGFFGPTASVKLDELVKTELAIVADSWAELGSAVWLMRATDPDLLDRWFPKDKRVGEGVRRGVQSFRTRDGLRVFLRDDVVAMARR
ncbi:MAG: hypothetical protein KJ749_06985, partial [Planctomycetes bacterium]|nr:hypothetical protein [Planctomycetota bacterium]